MALGTSELGMAGALGFEPRLSVLETDVLPLTPCPSATDVRLKQSTLFHFLMRRVLPAELAKLVSFQPIGIVFLIFHRRIVTLLAGRAGHVDDFSHLLTLVMCDA
jgi:hypothetical protein